MRAIGLRTGVMYFAVALATVAVGPVGGDIQIHAGYRAMQAFAGAMCLVGATCYATLRWKLGGFNPANRV